MRRILQTVSSAALAATFAAPILFLFTHLTLDQTQAIMLVAALVWFAATPFWMGRPKVEEEVAI